MEKIEESKEETSKPQIYNLPEGIYTHEVLDEILIEDIHIGRCYSKTPSKVYQCKKCKSIEFIVIIDDYFTGVKCKNCNYEISVHEG